MLFHHGADIDPGGLSCAERDQPVREDRQTGREPDVGWPQYGRCVRHVVPRSDPFLQQRQYSHVGKVLESRFIEKRSDIVAVHLVVAAENTDDADIHTPVPGGNRKFAFQRTIRDEPCAPFQAVDHLPCVRRHEGRGPRVRFREVADTGVRHDDQHGHHEETAQPALQPLTDTPLRVLPPCARHEKPVGCEIPEHRCRQDIRRHQQMIRPRQRPRRQFVIQQNADTDHGEEHVEPVKGPVPLVVQGSPGDRERCQPRRDSDKQHDQPPHTRQRARDPEIVIPPHVPDDIPEGAIPPGMAADAAIESPRGRQVQKQPRDHGKDQLEKRFLPQVVPPPHQQRQCRKEQWGEHVERREFDCPKSVEKTQQEKDSPSPVHRVPEKQPRGAQQEQHVKRGHVCAVRYDPERNTESQKERR